MLSILRHTPLLVMLIIFLVLPFFGIELLHADDDIDDIDDDDHVAEEEDSGIVGSFFHFLGDVIAFPFRIIGNVLDAIF